MEQMRREEICVEMNYGWKTHRTHSDALKLLT